MGKLNTRGFAISQVMNLGNNLFNEGTKYTSLSRRNLGTGERNPSGDYADGHEVWFKEGLCMADIEDSSKPRGRDYYLEHVLGPLIASGEVSDGSTGPYDDRKLRFDAKSSHFTYDHDRGPELHLAFGITHFAEHQKAMARSQKENNALRMRGLEEFDDQYAFFPRAPGVTGLVISSEGTAFLGTREYRGSQMLQPVAGHLIYKERIQDISLEEGLLAETAEEFGIPKEHVLRMPLVGAFEEPHSGDIDFTHLTYVDLGNSEVREAFNDKRKDKEHERLIEIPSFGDVQDILRDGTVRGETNKYSLFPATRGALMSIQKGEMSD